MDLPVLLHNNSFDRAGITKDCQQAICEYIWNGLDAGATKIEVTMLGEPLQEAMAIQISDNGTGIKHDTLDETFGAFLTSPKGIPSIRIKSQANEGKGRFSYLCFSTSAHWSTVVENDGVLQQYSIWGNADNRTNFSVTDTPSASGNSSTGTTVEFPISESSIIEKLSFPQIKQKLLQEFSWFLYLKKHQGVTLNYMGNQLDYKDHIDTELSIDHSEVINGKSFSITLIVWKKNVGNSSKVFFFSEDGTVRDARNTNFNRNTVGFFHGVYITSEFFNSSNTNFFSDEADQTLLGESDNHKKTSDELNQHISQLIEDAFRKFLVKRAEDDLTRMEECGYAPSFSEDEYGQLRKEDFHRVTRELYCVEPKIFYKLTEAQAKSLLGFLNLLLSSDERENLLGIVEQVVNLTAEQRKNFADILRRTKLEYILSVVGTIDKRLSIIETLKSIVYDMDKFANERDHIQKIIEQHFWIFGEQYHMLTADRTLQSTLREFEKMIESSTVVAKTSLPEKEAAQRADIFLYTQKVNESSESEMLIVELKAPPVKLTQPVLNQIIGYAHTIRKEPRFNSKNRRWKFYAVCKEVSEEVTVLYSNYTSHKQRGLVQVIDNFEIYAFSWDDIFQAFCARHSFLLDQLKLDSSGASGFDKAVFPSRVVVDEMTKRLTELRAM